MSLYYYTNPSSTHQYREATDRMNSLPGIMKTPSRIKCRRCEQMRNAQTAVDGVCHYCRRGA